MHYLYDNALVFVCPGTFLNFKMLFHKQNHKHNDHQQGRKHWGATPPPVFWLLVLSHATSYHVTINNGPPRFFDLFTPL